LSAEVKQTSDDVRDQYELCHNARQQVASAPVLAAASDQFASVDVSPATPGSSLRELCHDFIELTATIRWLARAAEAESGEELRDRLGAIGATAGQIAAICADVLDPPQCSQGVRLDVIAAEAVMSARAHYDGVIDIVSRPVTALVRTGDIMRILWNVLANACRAAGPAGRIIVEVDEADGQARVTIADSGHGAARAVAGGRAGLGLEIISALALKYGGSVHFGTSELGGLAVTVQVPAQRGTSN
jgi:signal transduction histidine kinase